MASEGRENQDECRNASYDSLEGAGAVDEDQNAHPGHTIRQNDEFYMQRMMEMLIADSRKRDEVFVRMLDRLTPQNDASSGGSTSQSSTSQNAFHVMPDMSKTIGFFDGDKDASKAEDWIKNIETSATLNRWPDSYRLETARAHLRGSAIYWYKTKQDKIKTWEDFKTEFYKSYRLTLRLSDKWDKMKARRQQRNESVISYFYEKLNLCQSVNLETDDTVQEILAGMYSRELAATLVVKQYSDFDNLLHDIITSEKIRYPEWKQSKSAQGDSKHKPNLDKKQASTQGSSVSTVPEENHRRNEKEQRRLPARNAEGKPLCFICKTYGHVSKYCKSNRQPETPKETLITTSTSNKDEPRDDNLKYFKVAQICGKDIEAYIDQGSKCVLLRKSSAETLGLKTEPVDPALVIKGYGRGEVRPCGKVYAEIEVDKAKAYTEIIIVPDDAQSIALLIGQPFTEQKHVTIVRRRDTLRLFNESSDGEDQEDDDDITKLKIPEPTKTTVNLWAKDKVIIPPNYVGFVTMITEPPTIDDLYIETHILNDKIVPRCIARPDEQFEVTLPVNNLTDKEIIISQGEKVLRANNCEESQEDYTEKIVDVCSIEESESTRVKQILEQCEIGDVTQNQKKKLEEIVNEFSHTFALNVTELGCYQGMHMKITLMSDDKITYRPYRLGYRERVRVKEQIEDLKQAGIIEDSNSEYASPILIVRKKNGEERICIDYRGLNKITRKEKYPLPLIDDQLDRLEGKKYFTSLDMKSGYYQVPLENDSKPVTAFVTPDGQYQFNRMPFGLVNGPAVFQKMINRVLGPLRYTIVMAYMDDLLLPSTTIDEGLHMLREVLLVLEKANLTLNPKKCSFFVTKVDYLGFQVSMGAIHPGERKVEAIRKFPRPQNIHQVRQFLGLTSYFRRFIRNYGIIAKSLTNLLKQSTPWHWSDEQEQAYEALKERLCQHPVLQIYSPMSPTEVHTDASQQGISGILLQRNVKNELHPVMYASRQTTKEESKYHSSELETLAVTWSCCEKFKPYLKDQQFKIVTDCSAVRSTFAKRDLIPRIGRWWLKMQEFDFIVEHRPGTSMKHVDALSRNPFDHPEETEIAQSLEVMVVSLDNVDWLTLVQRRDTKIQGIAEVLTRKTGRLTKEEKEIKENYILEEGRVYRKMNNKKLWVVPKDIRWKIMKLCHDDLGHPSVDKTIHKVLEGYWFPKLRRYVRGYIGACLECLYHKVPGGKRPGELRSIDKVGVPYHTIHMDHLGPFIKTCRGNAYIIVSIDGFTKHVMLKAVKDTSSNKATRFLNEIVDIFGPPVRVITDRGTAYTSNVFKKYCKLKNIQHIQNATATPRANGQVERVNRVITPALASLIQDPEGRDWDKHIGQLQYGLNNTIHKAIKTTPFNLLFNYEPRDYDGNPLIDERNAWQPEDDRRMMDEKRTEALERIKEDQRKQRIRYNKKRSRTKDYLEGDLVVVKREPASTGQSRKLLEKYAGPYIITERLPNDRYRVSDLPETQRTQKFYEGIVAVDSIKKYDPIIEESDRNSDSESDKETELQEISDNEKNEITNTAVEKRPHRKRKLPQKYKEYELEN